MKSNKKYNIGFLSDAEIISLFCVRTKEMEMIMETIGENIHSSNQHVLVIGPRGTGKSTLLLRCAAEVRQDPTLKERWLPIVFMEESYEVGSMGEFWLECLFQVVQQAADAEKKGLQAAYDELLLELNDDQLSLKAMARIMDFADKRKRRLLLIVENLNTLFNEIPGPQQDDVGWKLRHTLQNEPRIMLLASATSRFEQIDHSGKALFELFRMLQLKPLKTLECNTLWQNISGQPAAHGTVRAIEILTGGSPRLISIVAKFGARLSLNELLNELLDPVDDHTEYFKSHLENLPPKERRVYLALADLWIPATAKEITTRARQDIRSCSALLNRLISRGGVEDENSKPRRKLYYLNERMYNIYYLLRRRRRPDAMVTALLRFMTAIYPKQQILEIGHKLVSDCCTPADKNIADINCMAYAGLYNHLEKEKDLLLEKTPWAFIEKLTDKTIVNRKAFNELIRVAKIASEGRYEKVLDELDVLMQQVEKHDPGKTDNLWAYLLFFKGATLGEMDKPEEEIACYNELLSLFKDSQEIELQKRVAMALDNKGGIYKSKGNLKEAIPCHEEAIAFFERSGHAGRSLISKLFKARCLAEDGNHEESLEYIEEMFKKWTDNEADLPLEMFIRNFLAYLIMTDSTARILAMIEASGAAELLQPLVTALKLELGQETRVSVEVREVAADIQKQLAQMRKALKDSES